MTLARSGRRVAGARDYERCLDRWARVARSELVEAHQIGYLERGGGRWRRRAAARLPMLQLVVQPDRSIDFADPGTGFPGLRHPPPPGRVLDVWSDDLLTVSHSDDWSFLIHGEHPLDPRWLDRVASAGSHAWSGTVAVLATFAGPAPAGRFRLADVDAHTYGTLARVRDHRR